MLDTNPQARLAVIREKVEAGQRLSFDEGVFLSDQADLFTLGELANLVRERKNGNHAYYNVNTHLNPTNVCVYRCTFCAFRADLKSPKGYVMTDEQILQRAAEADRRGATELHIVGGLHHQLPYEWYLNVVRLQELPLAGQTGAQLLDRFERAPDPGGHGGGREDDPGNTGGAEHLLLLRTEPRELLRDHLLQTFGHHGLDRRQLLVARRRPAPLLQ